MPRGHIADAVQKKLVIHFPELRLAVYKNADLPFFLVCLSKFKLRINIINLTQHIVQNVHSVRRHRHSIRTHEDFLLKIFDVDLFRDLRIRDSLKEGRICSEFRRCLTDLKQCAVSGCRGNHLINHIHDIVHWHDNLPSASLRFRKRITTVLKSSAEERNIPLIQFLHGKITIL